MKPTEWPIAIQKLIETSGVRFGTSGARGLVVTMTCEVCFAYTAAFL
jgi:phosphomannomutase